MPNMSLEKNKMPSQEPSVRAHNFDEVALGYTEELAIDEAKRCLNCKNMPCVSGCPVKIHIPEFIAKVAEGDFEGAYEVICRASSLPPSADAYVRRKASANRSASAESRARAWASAGLSALSPIGT